MSIFTRYKRKLELYGLDLLIYTTVYALHFILNHLFMPFDDVKAELLTCVFNYAIFVLAITAMRSLFKVYLNVWRYANCRAYLELVASDLLGGFAAYLITLFIPAAYISVWKCLTVTAIFCLLSLSMRFCYQLMHKSSLRSGAGDGETEKVAILGAGMIGSLLAQELTMYGGTKYTPVFFIDTDPSKCGSRVAGLPVYHDNDALDKIREQGVTEIIVAIERLDVEGAARLFEHYGDSGCKIKVYDFPAREHGQDDKRVIREFKIEDLLFRDPITLVGEKTRAFYAGKTVLVTGGGGSIGSELCRQIARCEPKRLVIFDVYENNAYDIEQELKREHGAALDLVVEIGTVRDVARIEAVFAYHRPNIVFHAAAHKHVPLMERSSAEAIKNNVLGTYNTANAAEKYGTEKFILISTDKAVNPTNVMGATKRMCEMVVQCRTDCDTVFSAVRFGNVLGSNGSVVPLFARQIAAGGPVTITDKRIIRYFMTIEEASGLVMQAGAMAKRGELFVLDMGKPVKIYDLAVNMIRLSGLEPYRDIEIKEIGLRPGEKLYEELLVDKEHMQKTENKLIFIEHEEPPTRSDVETKLAILGAAVSESEASVTSDAVKQALRRVVPTFVDPDEINGRVGAAC